MDAAVHADELVRFWAKVVRGPGSRDCWIWTGAIGDDGYGRFWIRRSGIVRVVRPSRYALASVLGVPLGPSVVAEHETCDNPICTRAEAGSGSHVTASTQAANLARMGLRRRGGGDPLTWRHTATDRATLVARSRALRAAVRDGWDYERVRAALDVGHQQDPLF